MRMRIMRGMETSREHVLALEQRVRGAGVTVAAVLRDAKIDRSTWTRWRQGQQEPTLANWNRVLASVDRCTSASACAAQDAAE